MLLAQTESERKQNKEFAAKETKKKKKKSKEQKRKKLIPSFPCFWFSFFHLIAFNSCFDSKITLPFVFAIPKLTSPS